MTQSQKYKEKININCSICGKEYQVSYITYKKYITNHNYMCTPCRYKNMPEEYYKQRSILTSQRNKKYWANPENKRKASNRMIKRMHELNNDERAKNDWRIKLSTSHKQLWENMPEEEKLKRGEFIKIRWNSYSEEEQAKLNSKLQNGARDFWNNASEEDKREIFDKIAIKKKEYWNNLSREEFTELDYRKSFYNKELTNTEIILKETFNNINISYQCQYKSAIKHVDFDKHFPVNPITNSKLISPYHMWDFILHVGDSNILLDVDGPIHSITPGKYISRNIDIGAYIKFNDSKRPYQTDGMDAYIIECYDDILTDNTPVLHIQSNIRMNYKIFMKTLLSINNLSKIDKSDFKKIKKKKERNK